jgi:general secretion pathway protein D
MSTAGLDFAGTNAPAVGFPNGDLTAEPSRSGKALFFNDRTGILLVRATLAELDTVEQLLQVLNSTPPQVMIEAKFVEVTMDDRQALGFDWYLGQTAMGTNVALVPGGPPAVAGVFPGGGGPTSGVATLTGVMTDPQFKAVTQALQQAGTNGVRQLAGDQLDWPGRQATNASNIRVTAAVGGTLTGILTDPQLRVVLRALEQRSGVDVLSAPRVTTLSGRQAQIQVVDLQSIVTGLNPDALNAPGAGRATNASPFTTAAIPAGPSLDIIPWVAADGYTIQLTVIPTVTEFLGYDDPPKDGKVRIWEGGKSRLVDPPLPRFRVRQMVTQAQVWDGQTLVLGGVVTEELEKDRNGKPRKDGKSLRKQLLVFVTPTIVDPAGNRVHTAENLPYDPNRVPPQSPP